MSQCGEDQWILENLKPDRGIFFEVGSFDGIQSSNTLAFEDLGWTGVLVEADPFLACKSQETRAAITICGAASNYDGFCGFDINLSDRGLSGTQVWPFPDRHRHIRVPCFRLQTLIDWHYQKCDFLSIDTEGTELIVWDGIGPYRPKIVMMEYQTCDNPPQDKRIIDVMTRHSYTLRHTTKYNLILTRD